MSIFLCYILIVYSTQFYLLTSDDLYLSITDHLGFSPSSEKGTLLSVEASPEHPFIHIKVDKTRYITIKDDAAALAAASGSTEGLFTIFLIPNKYYTIVSYNGKCLAAVKNQLVVGKCADKNTQKFKLILKEEMEKEKRILEIEEKMGEIKGKIEKIDTKDGGGRVSGQEDVIVKKLENIEEILNKK